MNTTLSTRQAAILRFLRDYIRVHDYAPSIRDIQDGCDISSTSVVDYNLKALERAGFIQRDMEVSRGIRLLGRRRMVRVAIIGELRAGAPIPWPIPGQRTTEYI